MAEKIATRESYGAALAALGEKHDFLVLDADLSKSTKTEVFKKKAKGKVIFILSGRLVKKFGMRKEWLA